MKILILKNKGTKNTDDKNMSVEEYFTNRAPKEFGIQPVNFDFTEQEVDFNTTKYVTYGGKNNNGKDFYTIVKIQDEIRKIVPEGKYDAVVIFYKNPSWWLKIINSLGGYSAPNVAGVPLYDKTVWSEMPEKREKNAFKHELIHMLFRYYNSHGAKLTDTMDNTNGVAYLHNDEPLHKAGNYESSLRTINDYKQSLVKENDAKIKKSKYKYFTNDEFKGANVDLKQKADKGRGFSGTPWVITGGSRTITRNRTIGGAKNSYHLTDEAIDVRYRTETEKHKIIIGAAKAGFNGIIAYKTHIHLDVREVPYYGIA